MTLQTSSFILVNRGAVPIVDLGDGGPPILCVLWGESGYEYTPMNTRVKARVQKPNLLVWHDTAGEGTGPRIYRVLLKKKLSVHFAVDRKGLIWQYCDPGLFSCAHVGRGANSRSVGFEMANVVFPPNVRPGIFANLRRYWLTGREKMFGRPTVSEDYRGRKRRVLGHFKAQNRAAIALTLTCLRVFGTIPRRVPGDGGKPVSELVPPGWQGVCGHLHLTDRHVDPAQDGLYDLAERLVKGPPGAP